MLRFCKTDPGGAAGGEQRETVVSAFQFFTQLLCLFHNGQVGAHAGIVHSVKAQHTDGGKDFADAVFAGSKTEGFAQGDTDGGSNLYNDTFAWIVELTPYLIQVGFYLDGGGGAYGGALAAVYAVGFRQLLAEGRGDNHGGTAVCKINCPYVLYLITYPDAVAAKDAFAGIPDDGN